MASPLLDFEVFENTAILVLAIIPNIRHNVESQYTSRMFLLSRESLPEGIADQDCSI